MQSLSPSQPQPKSPIACVGAGVGASDGSVDGSFVGTRVGASVGDIDVSLVGVSVGSSVGDVLWVSVGGFIPPLLLLRLFRRGDIALGGPSPLPEPLWPPKRRLEAATTGARSNKKTRESFMIPKTSELHVGGRDKR